VTDHTVIPAEAGDDQQVVLLWSEATNLAERHAEAFGAAADRLIENLRQIPFAEREAAEPGDRGLLAQQVFDFCRAVQLPVLRAGSAPIAPMTEYRIATPSCTKVGAAYVQE
jgi:hypothetical protein